MIRTGDAARLPGTRIQNRCPVTSVGVDAIDSLMGGGLPLSSIYVVSESNSRRYAPLLQRYFLAEGLENKHDVFIHGPPLNVEDFIDNLPSSSGTAANQDTTSVPQEDMRIAWRYKTMPTMNSALSVKDKTKFDLTKKRNASCNDVRTIQTNSYTELWKHLVGLIRTDNYALGKGKQILRLFLHGVGSPLFEVSN